LKRPPAEPAQDLWTKLAHESISDRILERDNRVTDEDDLFQGLGPASGGKLMEKRTLAPA
jgi:hypothetical protein